MKLATSEIHFFSFQSEITKITNMKKLTKEEALREIKTKCDELKKLGSDIEFIKFLDKEGWKERRKD